MFFIEFDQSFLDLGFLALYCQGLLKRIFSQVFDKLAPVASSGLLLSDDLSFLESLLDRLNDRIVDFTEFDGREERFLSIH